MRVGIMAAGAVGGYFGGRLAAAGHDVVFFARGAHLAALREKGLTLKSTAGDLHVPKVTAIDDPKGVAPVDAVIFAVKLWDTETAGQLVKPIVTPQTRVITFQNGVDSLDRLRPILGDTVVGGSAQIATVISEPGVITHTSGFAIFRCGREGNKADPQLSAIVDASKAASLDMTLIPDIEVELWKKFVFLVGLSSITSGTRLSVGAWRNDPDTRAMFLNVMKEVCALAQAKGIALRDSFADERMAFIDKAQGGFKASMAHDLERGNRLELDWLAGGVVKMARELGVATPMNEAVYALLKPYRMGKPAVG